MVSTTQVLQPFAILINIVPPDAAVFCIVKKCLEVHSISFRVAFTLSRYLKGFLISSQSSDSLEIQWIFNVLCCFRRNSISKLLLIWSLWWLVNLESDFRCTSSADEFITNTIYTMHYMIRYGSTTRHKWLLGFRFWTLSTILNWMLTIRTTLLLTGIRAYLLTFQMARIWRPIYRKFRKFFVRKGMQCGGYWKCNCVVNSANRDVKKK